MIASKHRAPRFGPGRLVVDGRDTVVCRKTTFALSPSRGQERDLLALLAAACEVYNAALQERRDAWRHAGVRVGLFDQFRQVTELRGVRDDVLGWGIQPLRGALRRVDEAFDGFFGRVGRGETAGFPRFRSRRRFDTACWDEPTSWKVDAARRRLYVQGVGEVRLPKSARRQLDRLAARGGVPATLTVTRRRAGGIGRPRWVWRATVGFTGVAPVRTEPVAGPGSVVGADRGVAVTLATSEGALDRLPDATAARDRVADLQRRQATKRRGSRAWRQLGRHIARERRKAANRTDNWAREAARRLVATADVVALERLGLAAMTRSARGTVAEPGRNVAAKAGLNRALGEAALGRLAIWTCVKAEEAGRRVWLVDPAHTSQRCAACGHTEAANRPTRDRFACQACGHRAHADINAAINIADRARVCEAAWTAAGAPALPRPPPRLQRGRNPAHDPTPVPEPD